VVNHRGTAALCFVLVCASLIVEGLNVDGPRMRWLGQHSLRVERDLSVHKSILDAIRDGEWDYEPEEVTENRFTPTGFMPGTREKLSVLADRVRSGLPLWHGHDRMEYDDEA
jgi:hypothetical protein